MNVLYINHYAGSDFYGMEFRPFYLAKEWEKKGINTTILAADFSHLRKANPVVFKDFQENESDGIRYCWVKTIKYKGNGVSRIFSMFQFITKLIVNSRKMANRYRPDVVICSSTYPLDTYAGQLISKFSKAKLIHEVHDLWPLTPMELGGYSKNHPFIKVLQIAEKSAYKKSKTIVSILPNIKEYIDKLNINARIVNIPNGVLLKSKKELIPANKQIRNKISELHKENYSVVGYAGGISVSNAMMDLVKAAEVLNEKRIAFVIIGDGIEKKELIQYKNDKELKNVYFFNSINKDEVHSTLLEMDSLYIGSKKSKLYKYGVSANKIFDYMLTGKPIINAFDTEHSPLNYSNVSFSAEAENIESISNKIEEVSLLSEKELNEIREKTIKYVILNHSYEKLAEDFVKEF